MDAGAALAALSEHVGRPLGFTAEMAAYAVHEMVCENMASAARVHVIEKGRSIADHTLIAFGGAAPLHAARVAEKIGVDRVLVPRNAGVGSAVGFLRAPVSYEIVRSHHVELEGLDPSDISDLLYAMEKEARGLVAAGARGAPLGVQREAFMRYVGQGHEIAVKIPIGRLSVADRDVMRDAFERAYAELFKRTIPSAVIEVMSWSVLVAAEAQVSGVVLTPDAGLGDAEVHGMRNYFDGRSASIIEIPLYRRDRMASGTIVRGPALITERETTTFVSDTFDAHVDGQDNIVLQRKIA